VGAGCQSVYDLRQRGAPWPGSWVRFVGGGAKTASPFKATGLISGVGTCVGVGGLSLGESGGAGLPATWAPTATELTLYFSREVVWSGAARAGRGAGGSGGPGVESGGWGGGWLADWASRLTRAEAQKRI